MADLSTPDDQNGQTLIALVRAEVDRTSQAAVAESVGVSKGTVGNYLRSGTASDKTVRLFRRWAERTKEARQAEAAEADLRAEPVGMEWVRRWVEEEAAAARDQARAAYERARAVAHVTGGGDVAELRRELRTRGVIREEREREGGTE